MEQGGYCVCVCVCVSGERNEEREERRVGELYYVNIIEWTPILLLVLRCK